jgi:hypothetical protein
MVGFKTRLMVGLLAVGGIVGSLGSAPGPIGMLGGGLALIMLAIAIIDRRRFVIPNELCGAGFGLAICACRSEPDAMLAAIIVAALRGATSWLFDMSISGYAAATVLDSAMSSSLA